MELSVIIVNYNTKHLLELCLYSVKKAATGINCEIIVVDNNSTDGSKEFINGRFPDVKFIFNHENYGFAKASNRGYKSSSGRYLLFLNPDTIVSENSLRDCLRFFGSDSGAGAVGVRMLNGQGNYLKESKRGFPSPATSFFKLFGFTSVFPRSKIFARYYLGHLPENKNQEVEVLSGAFLMMSRDVMEKTGGFDEDFFMYGEDIDLSYRISQAGYKNFYLGEISITHFKGGSTIYDKNQAATFYEAMKLFVNKHYKGKKPAWFVFCLHTGIWIRKKITLVARSFS